MMKKNKKHFLNKRNITLLSLSSLMISIPIMVTEINVGINSSIAKNNTTPKEVVDYIKKNSKVIEKKETVVDQWEVSFNGKNQIFKTPNALMDFIESNYLTQQSYITNLDLSKFVNKGMGYINESELNKSNSQLYKNDQFNKNKTMAYRGNNDVSYKTEQEAKKSFLNSSEAYFFNGIYFKSKSDLSNYLMNVYFKENTTKYNSIVLKGPNGITSHPINISNPEKAISEIKKFIYNNTQVNLKYENSQTGEIVNINKKNIDEKIKYINIKDLDHIHVQSNQGESRYVVDNMDNGNLIGPYFYKGNLDIGAFKNKKMWRKTEGVKNQVYIESKIDALVGSFFTSIINDDVVASIKEAEDQNQETNGGKKEVKLFRTLLELPVKSNGNETNEAEAKTISLDDWFMYELGRLSPKLKEELIKNQLQLMQGNKYNTFYKIPVFYNFLLHRIVSWGLGQEVLDLVVYYFTQVTNFIQDVLEIILVDENLLYKNEGGVKTKFNAKDFFQIGNPEYDINTSVEYFMNEIKKYKGIVAGAWSYIGAINNMFLLGGLIPFSSNDPQDLFDFGLLTKEEFSSIEVYLKAIYDIFSSSTYDDMLKVYITTSSKPEIVQIQKLPDFTKQKEAFDALVTKYGNHRYDVILKSIGLNNNEYLDMVRATILGEIRVYNESGSIFRKSYLMKLYNSNHKLSRLDTFINYVTENPDADIYRVYMAFITDIRLKKHIFANPVATSNPTQFALAIAQLVSIALGGIGLVSNAITTIYNKKNSKNDWDGPINDLSDNGLLNQVTNGKDNNSSTSGNNGNNQNNNWDDNVSWDTQWSDDTRLDDVIDGNLVRPNSPGSLPPPPDDWLDPPSNNWNPDGSLPPPPSDWLNPGGSLIPDNGFSPDGDSGWVRGIKTRASSTDGSSTGRRESFYDAMWQPEWNTLKPVDKNSVVIAAKTPKNHSKTRMPSYKPTHIFMYEGSKSGWYDLEKHNSFLENRKPKKPSDGVNLVDFKISYDGDVVDGKGLKLGNVFDDSFSFSNKNFDVGDGAPSPKKLKSIKKTSKWSGRLKSGLTKAANAINNVILPVAGTAFMILEVVSLFMELFRKDYIQSFYVYTTADGTEFIWDGGMSVSEYLGFKRTELRNIDSMDLIDPVQVTLPQLEEFYYFNAIKNYDSNSNIRYQIEYFLKNGVRFDNETMQIGYSLSDVENTESFASIDDLYGAVLSSLNITLDSNTNKYDFSRINKNSIYFDNSNFMFSNGLVATSESQILASTQNIINNIRKSQIIQMPELDANNNAIKTSEFVLPEKYWSTLDGGKIIENTTSNKYLIDHSANKLKENVVITDNHSYDSKDYLIENAKEAENASKKIIEDQFYLNINVASTNAMFLDFVKGLSFSQMSNFGVYKTVNIYEVKNIGSLGKIKFLHKEDALRFIKSQINIKEKSKTTTTHNYVYNKVLFTSEEKIYDFATKLCSTYGSRVQLKNN